MGALDRSWALFRQSLTVLAQDREILLFPVLSAISAVLVGASFFYPLHVLGTFQLVQSGRAAWVDYLPLFSWYYANFFVVIFFNCALAACVDIRLRGGDPTVGDGLRAAASRLDRIAAWTLVAATVGLVLNAIERNNRRGGRWIAGMLGVGWTLITYLIVPVLVFENQTVFGAIGRSAALFRKTWGEQLTGNFGFGLLNFLLALPGVLAGYALWRVQPLAAIAVTGVYVLVLAAISSAVKGVFTVALYRYAVTGDAPLGFTPDALGGVRRSA